MEERLQNIEQALSKIAERNIRVEKDKAWERSWLRRLSIFVLTYIVAVIVLYFLRADVAVLTALIPALGYILSTLSLRYLRNIWERFCCS